MLLNHAKPTCTYSCIKNYKEPIKNKNAIHILNPGTNAQADMGEILIPVKGFPLKALQKDSVHQVIHS